MTAISKYVYIDKLDYIVKKYNNTYHTTIKMKPADVKDNTYIDFKKEVNDKNPKFEVGDHVRISKYKNIFAKGYMPNWSEEIFIIKKIKSTVPGTYVINDLNGEEIIGIFMKMNCKRLIKKNSKQKKYLRKKVISYIYVTWKGYDNSFNSWIDKKTLYKMSQCFPKPYKSFDGDINVIIDLSNYATKDDIKNISHVNT